MKPVLNVNFISFSPVLVCIFFFYAPISTHLNCASLPLVSLVHIVRTWPGMQGLWSAPESLSPTACATVIKLLHWRSVLDSSPLSHAHCQLSSCEWELDKECEMRESWKMESEWEDERKNCTGAAFYICHRSYLVHLFILCLFSRFQHPRNEGVFTLWLRKPQITSLLSEKVKRSFPHGQQKQAQTMSRAVWEVLKVQENTKHVYRDSWWKLSDKPAKQHQAPATKRNSWCRREKFPSWRFFFLTSKICTHLQMRTDSIR